MLVSKNAGPVSWIDKAYLGETLNLIQVVLQ